MADTFGPRELTADEIAACAEQLAKNDAGAEIKLGDLVVTEKSVTEKSWAAIAAKVKEVAAAAGNEQSHADETPDPAPASKPKRQKRIIVDELSDVAVSSGRSTVIFRPGQVIDAEKTPHLLELAKQNNIQLRER